MTPVDGSHTLGCGAPAAVVVLAGGRSTRMGTAKAALEWHGSTMLRHVTGIVGRAVDGPVIVVRAPGQQLPAIDPQVQVPTDPEAGRGPMQAWLSDWPLRPSTPPWPSSAPPTCPSCTLPS